MTYLKLFCQTLLAVTDAASEPLAVI